MCKKLFIALLFMAMSITANASVVIDFEELSSLGSSWGSLGSQEYITQGFRFTTDADSFDYASFYGDNAIALSVGDDFGSVQLQSNDNSAFDAIGISFISDIPLDLTINGTKSNLTTVQHNITTSGNWITDEYVLVDFNDLLYMSWDCDPDLHFDNIIVPEPMSILTMLGVMLFIRSKSKKA